MSLDTKVPAETTVVTLPLVSGQSLVISQWVNRLWVVPVSATMYTQLQFPHISGSRHRTIRTRKGHDKSHEGQQHQEELQLAEIAKPYFTF